MLYLNPKRAPSGTRVSVLPLLNPEIDIGSLIRPNVANVDFDGGVEPQKVVRTPVGILDKFSLTSYFRRIGLRI